jgi:hypothetical protein
MSDGMLIETPLWNPPWNSGFELDGFLYNPFFAVALPKKTGLPWTLSLSWV